MHRSLNEIEKTLIKAGVGLGWPLGLAEETASAATWLVSQGRDGVAAALNALRAEFSKATAERTAHGWQIDPGPVVATGPTALDLLELASPIHLGHVDQPLLLAGLAAMRAPATGSIEILGQSGTPLFVCRDGLEGTAPHPGPIRLAPCPHQSSHTAGRGIAVDERHWSEAERLAALTYVPASDASRTAGAGAGAIDNE
ncbi:MAG: DUF3726 domain-containing protein [Alphaproteobacteria bacterium]|nr:DUF3726 domain-containing protein [Alphaproteobacteria bacterium]